MTLIIAGGGMAGLLAANMLRRHHPLVYERQESLPHNHAALLRFRSPVVSGATGIPFQKVHVTKAIYHQDRLNTRPNLQLVNLYSQKVLGKITERSIMNLDPCERYIAPANFIEQMSRSVEVRYGTEITQEFFLAKPEEPWISTLPMPVLMALAAWDMPIFQRSGIWTIRTTIIQPETTVYQTLYYPGEEWPMYRASLSGNILIIECMGMVSEIRDLVNVVLYHFGLSHFLFEEPTVTFQKYGKLLPILDAERRSFIAAMTDSYNCYSVGRFATWRQILLDDVVQDVLAVERMMESRDLYTRRMHTFNRGV